MLHLTALNTLEGKGGNPVRGYPSILPCLLCLSCSVCFLNTTHVGEKDDEKNGLNLHRENRRQKGGLGAENERERQI